MLKSNSTKFICTFLGSLCLVIIAACGEGSKKSFDANSGTSTLSGDSTKGQAATPDTSGTEGILGDTLIDNRTITQVLCEEGPKVVGKNSKGNFDKEFALVCANGTTNETFKKLLLSAFSGTGEPAITTVANTSDDNYVTNLVLAYSVKMPIADPSLFADYKAHDIFAPGVKAGNSELKIAVESRQSFPGKASVEQVILNYNLLNAEGAGILDKRRTEFNTYLLLENTRDVVVSTEVLLDEATNEQYHQANGMNIGIKDNSGQTYMIFIINLVIKNRIDPARMQKTMLTLNGQVAKMIQAHVVAGNK